MKTFLCTSVGVTVLGLVSLLAWGEPPQSQSNPPAEQPAAADKSESQLRPKLLSQQTLNGIAYLVAQQHADGGWGQGGGWRSGAKGGRVEGAEVQDPSDVGNTAMALLVLLRAGHTPEKGPHSAAFSRGLDFIYQHVEGADQDSLYVTDVRDTQLQTKIGQYVDTFAATWLMSELKGSLTQPPARLLAAIDKTVHKIERNQKTDGTFGGNRGWAAVLSQGMCGVALNSAAQNGIAVNKKTLERDFQLATKGVDVKAGTIDMAAAAPRPALAAAAGRTIGGFGATSVSAAGGTSASNAGVELYQLSVQCAQLNANVATSAPERAKAAGVLSSRTATDAEKQAAKAKIEELDSQAAVAGASAKAVTTKLADKRFTAGFGNNGGEEFLSYMNISLALRIKGGPEWEKWDRQVAENLVSVQNTDGSWSGHHCITGRTFCTAAALLTIMVDRAPLGSQAAAIAAKQ